MGGQAPRQVARARALVDPQVWLHRHYHHLALTTALCVRRTSRQLEMAETTALATLIMVAVVARLLRTSEPH